MTKPTDPMRCVACTKVWAQKHTDPDGLRRCFNCSMDPVTVARRATNGRTGAATAAKLQGVPLEARKSVIAGTVDLGDVREKMRSEKAKGERELSPIPLATRDDVLKFLARATAELMDEKPNGWASAAASLVKAALSAQGVDEMGDGDEEEQPRGFTYRTTVGDKVAVRGRDEDPVH